MADKEKGIRSHEGIAFNLSSAAKPFRAVAILQPAQQGKLYLTDTVGTYLTGFAKEIAEQMNIHHLLSGASGLNMPTPGRTRGGSSDQQFSYGHHRR